MHTGNQNLIRKLKLPVNGCNTVSSMLQFTHPPFPFHTTHITQHTSHNTQHTSHNTHHNTHHTTHITQHTSHNTHHTTHITQHTSHNTHHTPVDIHVHPPSQDTFENVMRVSQMLVQGSWNRYSPLLQLPHLQPDHLRHFKTRKVKSTGDTWGYKGGCACDRCEGVLVI